VTDANAPVGALDIGSNTVRMLVARPAKGKLKSLLDLGTYAALGRGVDRTGELQEETQERALASIAKFVDKARAAGAREIAAVATSAIRDARNGPHFIERVRQAAGIEPQIISGDREAELTFIGATGGRRLEDPTVVVDVGGGSGEVLVAEGGAPLWGKALPIGSRRLTERFVRSDPPSGEQLDAVAAHVRSLLETLPTASPLDGIFAGGTAKALPAILNAARAPTTLTADDFGRILSTLKEIPADGVARQFDLPPERAQVLPAGAATLAEIARFYHLEMVEISATGIREGMIIDLLRKQGRWQ
jgi:exopolyphosphatase/guanosine-5'-triphosphate,3'-diphosphate pyrophosphatase